MVDDKDLEIMVHDIYECYGYDFSGYSMASFKRRVTRLLQMDGFAHFSDFLLRLKSDPEYFKKAVEEITVNVTEMFRDPAFYKYLRTHVIPELATKPFIRIWHAGCSTGEEAYSMAILLKEANLLHKALIYGTDLNPMVLNIAKKGIFPLRMMVQYSENYIASGGKGDFSSYYTANYGFAGFNKELSDKMIFSQHNLVSDRSFNEFDLIMCRNVMIYFDAELQEKALALFDDSLANLGYLALGTKETLKFSSLRKRYQQQEKEKLWRKLA